MYFKGETDWQKEIITNISKTFNLDKRVVREIVYYPLLFLHQHIIDDICERPIRIRKLGVWVLRGNRGKKKVLQKQYNFLLEHSEELYSKLTNLFNGKFDSKEAFERHLWWLYRNQNFNPIRRLYSLAQKEL